MIHKLIIDARMLTSSGIGRYLTEILLRIKNDYDILCLINKADKEFFVNHQIKFRIFDAKFYSVKEQLLFPKYGNKDAIFWFPHFNVPLLPFQCKKRVVTIHDVYHLAFYNQLSLAQKIYAKLCINRALKKSDKVITVSEFSKKEIIKHTKQEYSDKISTIYNGVSGDFKTIDVNTTKPEEKLKAKYILFVGNVKPHKNLKRAIFAFQKLTQENPELTKNLRFKIIGRRDGFITGEPELTDLIENDNELSRLIEFTGFLSDDALIELYRNAEGLIFPSYYEGFGLPPLEAMASGCPVILSNAACMPEICGNAALYFDPFDVNDISEKLKQIIKNEDLRRKLIQKGYKQANRFTWEISASKHKQLFNELIDEIK